MFVAGYSSLKLMAEPKQGDSMRAFMNGSMRFGLLLLVASAAGLTACAPVKSVPSSATASAASNDKAETSLLAHQGAVSLLVSVRADGTVADATVERSTGDSELDRGAIDAAKKWPFGPGTVNGLAQDSLSRVSMVLNVPSPDEPKCPPSPAPLVNAYSPLRLVGTGLRGDNPGDASRTIYLTVLTDGCGLSTLSAVWRYDGSQLKPRLVNRTDQSIVSRGPATTVFNLKNPQLWPLGSYRVDIEVNGLVVATRGFVIDGKGMTVAQ
jgi:TonB family protein